MKQARDVQNVIFRSAQFYVEDSNVKLRPLADRLHCFSCGGDAYDGRRAREFDYIQRLAG